MIGRPDLSGTGAARISDRFDYVEQYSLDCWVVDPEVGGSSPPNCTNLPKHEPVYSRSPLSGECSLEAPQISFDIWRERLSSRFNR
jgi:hypothetical protein